jgi:RimJ/RimL family protein N-acetyltransferase
MSPRIVLTGEPLIDESTALRPWREADIPAIVAACQDPEISRWTRVPSPYGETDARAFIFQRHDLLESGTSAPFAIVSGLDHRELLGSIALLGIDWQHTRAEVGYWLAREARGHGHVTRAVRLICAWGFSELRLERISLLAATGNGPSQRVAERAGFAREAVLRSYMRTNAERQDMVAFALLGP